MRTFPFRPSPSAVALAALLCLCVACEGDRVKVLPAPPPDLSGAWDTGVTVWAGTCDDLYVGMVSGRILTLWQEDGALLAQANAGDSLHCGPVRSCGSGTLRDRVMTLSLTGSVAFDADCTLEFSEEITGIVGRGMIVPLGPTTVPASLDPLLRIEGPAVIDVTTVGTCPVRGPCRFDVVFGASPRGCEPGSLCPAVIVCAPPWECAVPL